LSEIPIWTHQREFRLMHYVPAFLLYLNKSKNFF
jgi:hypothetical protein